MRNILDILKQEGYSLTQPRRAILAVLSPTPLSAQDLEKKLKRRGIKIDLVTIYRVLDIFAKLGFVRKTQFEEKTARYEMVVGQKHHHHPICQACGTIEDIAIDEKRLIKQVEQRAKFRVQRHAVEFFGLCLKCA